MAVTYQTGEEMQNGDRATYLCPSKCSIGCGEDSGPRQGALFDVRPECSPDEIVHKDQWAQVWDAIRAEVGQPESPASIPWPAF